MAVLLPQDSLSFSMSFESKPYNKNYRDTIQLTGKCVLEGKADFFIDTTAITLSHNSKELLSNNSQQIDIICVINHHEKYFYYTDKFQNISTLLKKLSLKYNITNKEMYVKCYDSGFVINTMPTDDQISIETNIKINKQKVDKYLSILIEERDYHENDFPGAK